MNDPYTYRDSGVLQNKLGIRDERTLNEREALLTARRYGEVLAARTPPATNTRAYQDLHRQLFQDVYRWAGRLRIVDISKPGSTFARAHLIEASLDREFKQLPNHDTLRKMDADRFADTMARHLSELNAVHPFREGNGRTMRLHLQLHAMAAEKTVSVQAIDRTEWLEASRTSFLTANHASLAKIIRDAMEGERQKVEPIRGAAGIAMPPAMDLLLPPGTKQTISVDQAKQQIERYLPTAQVMSARQHEQLSRLGQTSNDMRQLAERAAQEVAFLRDPKGPFHHLQLIEQRRYDKFEVNWSEGMDPLQRVRSISAGSAAFLSKMAERDVKAADRALHLSPMPRGVGQVERRLADQFMKNTADENRADPRLAPFQLAVERQIADARAEGATKAQLVKVADSAKRSVAEDLAHGKTPEKINDKPKGRER
ncbi:Fic family protein [Novosphingobium sp. RD2P27]|uniref:protein adenylyltransferase n=1 Tax=Novosphingobium kalidii TaxID=3230299 RepID=A0ABV2D3M8_9SPHN